MYGIELHKTFLGHNILASRFMSGTKPEMSISVNERWVGSASGCRPVDKAVESKARGGGCFCIFVCSGFSRKRM